MSIYPCPTTQQKTYGGTADRVVSEEIKKCVPSRMEQPVEV